MSAAELFSELAGVGITLSADEGALCYDAPAGVMTPGLVARVRAAKPALLLVASDAWRRELAAWRPELQGEWRERAAIRTLDGGQPRALAEAAAFLEVRSSPLAHALDLAGALEAALGAQLVGFRSSTRPPDAEDEPQPTELPVDQGEAPSRRPGGASPLCCRACGCRSLPLEGQGPCFRCGWRRAA